ncbi:hypothetical protein DFH07DRAFT_854245 [Mycena maculata]|uniref:Uncharacterized protein n=1 Tax=Mycena maculata TaxID=230809 RepID=A0AAD7MN95_9AGAR|nr:hypothetical protein DFH07DRAFT_854245 [Mycena maculata]
MVGGNDRVHGHGDSRCADNDGLGDGVGDGRGRGDMGESRRRDGHAERLRDRQADGRRRDRGGLQLSCIKDRTEGRWARTSTRRQSTEAKAHRPLIDLETNHVCAREKNLLGDRRRHRRDRLGGLGNGRAEVEARNGEHDSGGLGGLGVDDGSLDFGRDRDSRGLGRLLDVGRTDPALGELGGEVQRKKVGNRHRKDKADENRKLDDLLVRKSGNGGRNKG